MLVIIDYKAGNLTSVRLACEALGASPIITSDPAQIAAATRLIFPGVGAAPAAMRNLEQRGLVQPIKSAVGRGVPFFGICLGMQILCQSSAEGGDCPTLGLIPGRVIPFNPANPRHKIPHMGWNQVDFRSRHPLFDGLKDGSDYYFVHSYYPVPASPADCLAETGYAGVTFASVIGRGNIFATQFHPEKSGHAGLTLLKNYLSWDGKATC